MRVGYIKYAIASEPYSQITRHALLMLDEVVDADILIAVAEIF